MAAPVPPGLALVDRRADTAHEHRDVFGLEVGGQLSHGAIIAREYGIPADINVVGAMHFIQDGQTI